MRYLIKTTILVASILCVGTLESANAQTRTLFEIPYDQQDMRMENDSGFVRSGQTYMRKKITNRAGNEFAIMYEHYSHWGAQSTTFLGVCRWENSDNYSSCAADEELDTLRMYNAVIKRYRLPYDLVRIPNEKPWVSPGIVPYPSQGGGGYNN